MRPAATTWLLQVAPPPQGHAPSTLAPAKGRISDTLAAQYPWAVSILDTEQCTPQHLRNCLMGSPSSSGMLPI